MLHKTLNKFRNNCGKQIKTISKENLKEKRKNIEKKNTFLFCVALYEIRNTKIWNNLKNVSKSPLGVKTETKKT